MLVHDLEDLAVGASLATWAEGALEEGFDTPSLRTLAALGAGARLPEALPSFRRVLRELGVKAPEEEELRRLYLRELAGGIASGGLDPIRGLEAAHRFVIAPLGHPPDLRGWCKSWSRNHPTSSRDDLPEAEVRLLAPKLAAAYLRGEPWPEPGKARAPAGPQDRRTWKLVLAAGLAVILALAAGDAWDLLEAAPAEIARLADFLSLPFYGSGVERRFGFEGVPGRSAARPRARARNAVVVTSVVPGGAFAAAGVLPGMAIVGEQGALIRALHDMEPGERRSLVVQVRANLPAPVPRLQRIEIVAR